MAKKPVAPKLADVVNSPEYKGMSDFVKQQIENALLESKGKPPLPKTNKKAISAEEVLANPAMLKAIKEKIGEEAAEDFLKKADEKSNIDDTDKLIVVDKQNKVRKTKQKTRKQQELEQQENTQRSLKDFILGKGSKAFNKMFPQLGKLMGGVYRGGDRSANNNTTTQTNTSSNASGTTAILSSIIDSQKTSVDILQQILTAIKATPRTPPPTTGQNQTPPPPASNQNQTPPPASTQNQRSQSGQNQTAPPPASRTTTAPAPRQGAQMNPATAAATVAAGAAIAGAAITPPATPTTPTPNATVAPPTPTTTAPTTPTPTSAPATATPVTAPAATTDATRSQPTTELTDRQKALIERVLRSRKQEDDDEIRTIAENLVKATPNFGNRNESGISPVVRNLQEQADIASLDSAIDSEQLRRSGNSEGLLIAGKLVLPGRPLTRNQMTVLDNVGDQRVNRYPSFVIDQYNRQKSGNSTPESAATPAPVAPTPTPQSTTTPAPAIPTPNATVAPTPQSTTTPATSAAPAAIASPVPTAVNPEYSEEAAAGTTRPYINPEYSEEAAAGTTRPYINPEYSEEAAAGTTRPYINPEYSEEAAAADATPITAPVAQHRNIPGNSSSIDYDRLFNLLFHGRLSTSVNSTPIAPQAVSATTAPYYAEEAAAGITRSYINPEYSEEAAAGASRSYINPETPIYDRGEPTPESPNIENLISSYQEIIDRYQNLIYLSNDQSDFAINILTMRARYTANRNFLGRVSTGNNMYDTSIIQRLIINLENIESRRLELLSKVSSAFRNCLQFSAQLARLRSFNSTPMSATSRIESDNKQLETFVSDYNKLLSDFNSIEENSDRENAIPVPSPIPDSQIYDRGEPAPERTISDLLPVPSPIPDSQIYDRGEPAPERTISDLLREHRENENYQRQSGIQRQINRGQTHYTAASNLENYSPEPMPIRTMPSFEPPAPSASVATPTTSTPPATPPATPTTSTPPATPTTSTPPATPATPPATPIVPAGISTYDIDVKASRIRSPQNRAARPVSREELTANQLNDMVLDTIANRDATKPETANATEARRRIRRIMDYNGDGSGDGGEDGGSGGDDATPKSASQEAEEEDLRENRILNFKADEIFFKADKFEFEGGEEEDEQDASKTTSNNAGGGGGGGTDATPAPNTASTGGGGGGSSSSAGGANSPAVSTGSTTGGGADATPAPTGASGDTGGEGINGATTGGDTTSTGDAAQAPNPAATAGLNFAPGVDKRIKPGIADKVKDVQSGFGKGLSITSGYRDPARNAKVGGASGSKHLTGDAVDIKFAGNQEDTINFIKAASAKGLGGIGVYGPGFVHIDTGAKRVWGPDYRAGSIPSWAKAALNDHMTGQKTATPAGSSPTSGAAVAEASAQNDMSIRSPSSAPSVQPFNSESTNPVARSESSSNPIDPNNPGPLEPADAGLRYARLFSMAA